jgi:iron complex transport system substrate-binding protein
MIGGKYQHILYDQLMSTSEWSNNNAVKNGNVFKVPMGISAWNRYGIEIAIMIPWTSAVVYPEYFEYDLVQETIKFYKEFSGYTLSEQQAQYILEGLTPSGEKEITN